MAGRPINEALDNARLMGDRTYGGSKHEPCGTTTRYTTNNGCVACARAKQKDLRAAAKRGLTEPDASATDDDLTDLLG